MHVKDLPTARRIRSDAAAFTLVEVVMSIVILSIGCAALMGCFSFSYFGMQMARENQRATQILLERAEAIRLCSWDQVNTAGFIPATFAERYDPTATNGASGAVYTGTVSVSAFAPSGTTPSYSDNMRQLTITLRWNTRQVTRCRTNITYIAKNGVQNYVY